MMASSLDGMEKGGFERLEGLGFGRFDGGSDLKGVVEEERGWWYWD